MAPRSGMSVAVDELTRIIDTLPPILVNAINCLCSSNNISHAAECHAVVALRGALYSGNDGW